jgi:hypothetical protein
MVPVEVEVIQSVCRHHVAAGAKVVVEGAQNVRRDSVVAEGSPGKAGGKGGPGKGGPGKGGDAPQPAKPEAAGQSAPAPKT